MSKTQEFIAERIVWHARKHDFPNSLVKVQEDLSGTVLEIASCGIKVSGSVISSNEATIRFEEISSVLLASSQRHTEKSNRTELELELKDNQIVVLTLPAGNTFYGVFNILLVAVKLAG